MRGAGGGGGSGGGSWSQTRIVLSAPCTAQKSLKLNKEQKDLSVLRRSLLWQIKLYASQFSVSVDICD